MCGAGHSGIDPGMMPWAPIVMQAHIPARAHYAESPVAILASLNDYALIDNLGHALFDFAYPVWTLYCTCSLLEPKDPYVACCKLPDA